MKVLISFFMFISILLNMSTICAAGFEKKQNDSYGIIKFGFNLYKKTINDKQNKNSNIIISPYSIYTALSLLSAGAEKSTLKEIETVLNVSNLSSSVHENIYELNKRLLSVSNDQNYQIHIANSIWIQTGLSIYAEYQHVAQKFYNAITSNVNFAKDPEKARILINKWVENNTKNLIQELLPKGLITPLTAMVLVNAIYFKALWESSFDNKLTKEDTFTCEDKSKVKVPMMYQKTTTEYFEDKEMQILKLNYKNNIYSMIFVLPKTQDIATLEQNLDYENFKTKFEQLQPKEINIYIPKFSITSPSIKLNDYLQSLGIKKVFGKYAELTKLINDEKKLSVSAVVHKAKIIVDEQGSEAAAATGVVISRASLDMPEPVIFKANKPFLYFIMHNQTKTILFMGKLSNPSKT